MLAMLAAILLVGIIFAIGLVAYVVYLTREPDVRTMRRHASRDSFRFKKPVQSQGKPDMNFLS